MSRRTENDRVLSPPRDGKAWRRRVSIAAQKPGRPIRWGDEVMFPTIREYGSRHPDQEKIEDAARSSNGCVRLEDAPASPWLFGRTLRRGRAARAKGWRCRACALYNIDRGAGGTSIVISMILRQGRGAAPRVASR